MNRALCFPGEVSGRGATSRGHGAFRGELVHSESGAHVLEV